jgi:hypothetical protein
LAVVAGLIAAVKLAHVESAEIQKGSTLLFGQWETLRTFSVSVRGDSERWSLYFDGLQLWIEDFFECQ